MVETIQQRSIKFHVRSESAAVEWFENVAKEFMSGTKCLKKVEKALKVDTVPTHRNKEGNGFLKED